VVSNPGLIFSRVYLGGGNDKYTGGNNRDDVEDDIGDDTYVLGGGNDHFRWLGEGTDTVDGGAGTFDEFSGESAPDSLWLNLDTKSIVLGGVTLGAGKGLCQTGVITVKGFEVAYGGSKADILAGGTGNETLLGGAGADLIYGNKGADDLFGGSEADQFIYLALTDSGTTAATRDVIHSFEGANANGGDVIDLSAIDANTKTANNDSFTLIGGNVAFTAAGQLRWVDMPDQTLLQGDVNGDGKADFSIAVVGSVDFSSVDGYDIKF
jgi:Ca2+-binding RTX toxin-like protein